MKIDFTKIEIDELYITGKSIIKRMKGKSKKYFNKKQDWIFYFLRMKNWENILYKIENEINKE